MDLTHFKKSGKFFAGTDLLTVKIKGDCPSTATGRISLFESNGIDLDGNGRVDGAVDANGIPASSNGGVTPADTDGDGKISLGEFLLMIDKGSGEKCEQMKVKELLTMFRSIDTNNSGGINF